MIRQTLLALSILAATLAAAQSAQASYAAKWFDGNWDCKIDGRSAKMTWRMADDMPNSKYLGKFSDSGGAWVPLSELSSNSNTLSLRYLGGEPATWGLTYAPQQRSAVGFTTWRGKKYPLSCTKNYQDNLPKPLEPSFQPPIR
jgi:Family of unknown function (DUF6006)